MGDWDLEMDREMAEGEELKKLAGFDFTKPLPRNERHEQWAFFILFPITISQKLYLHI